MFCLGTGIQKVAGGIVGRVAVDFFQCPDDLFAALASMMGQEVKAEGRINPPDVIRQFFCGTYNLLGLSARAHSVFPEMPDPALMPDL